MWLLAGRGNTEWWSLTGRRRRSAVVVYPRRASFTSAPHSLAMAKNSLRDKLEGDELDLSMMSIAEVPVKEIVSDLEKPAAYGVGFGFTLLP